MGRDEALDRLARLYARVDALYEPYTCDCCGRCCALHETGLEPWLFPIEREYLVRAAQGLVRAAPPRCPFQNEAGSCRVYEARPFGCRSYFCPAIRSPKGIRRGGPPHEKVVALTIELMALAEAHAPGREPVRMLAL